MEVKRFEIEKLKKPQIAEEPRPRRTPDRDQPADGPMPPSPLHVNLHLTTVAITPLTEPRPAGSGGIVRSAIPSLTLGVLIGLCAVAGLGQTTQGLISGRLLNSVTGRPVDGAMVNYSSSASALNGSSVSDASGYYYLPLLSPGAYRVRVTAEGFQSQEVQELELLVAARIELDFRLRPLNDVWEAGQYNSVFLPGSRTIVTFFGPDVSVRGCTLPWQLGAAQEPGPLYFGGSLPLGRGENGQANGHQETNRRV
jgi:carboxypeptidase family protein